jgi:hypothetical protein
MNGSTPMETLTADMINSCVDDLWSILVPVFVEQDESKKVSTLT